MSFLAEIIGWVIGIAVMAFVLFVIVRLAWEEIEKLMEMFNMAKKKKKGKK